MDIRFTPERDGVTIAYDVVGPELGRPLLMVHGLAAQLVAWPPPLLDALVARGFRCIRFDNRDIGESTHLHDAPEPDVLAALGGDASSASYNLSDMAADAVHVLDTVGVDRAHVLGVSMGGMIAQTVAIEHPERVLSLTSVMSTPSPRTGPPTEAALGVLFAPPPTTREEAIARSVQTFAVIGSPGFPQDEQWLQEVAGVGWDRGRDPLGVTRQLLAIQASGDRTEGLRTVSAPTLVFHGEADPLVQIEGGRATAAAVPGARLVTVPGMGHDLPQGIWDWLVDEVAGLAERVSV